MPRVQRFWSYEDNVQTTSRRKRPKRRLVAIWSDTKNDSSDEYVDECHHVMAFAASTDKVIVENASDNEDSSDNEVPKKMTL